ncbi:hypothetical protein DUNSADRAFT_11379 [Dunaliella salina]|uniref:Uncharacterized protein n=1 Tax=Dunaliella salina TaxID=3046 RepID=A0ABQ7GDI0_DUNSA|nr:hypothetical protein DUNSADRAFT_11379 [Dunaliella salina]|eukprot:KAF5832671.1 hypothetical protein DUNSADRAFT_11379 [Dunaliella salina]
MTVADRLELEALAYAAWPSSSPEDRCARKMVEILARNKHGPNGSYSMRASTVGIELSKTDPAAFRSVSGLKAVVAHAAPHVCVVDDPTCANPVNAGLRLLHKSLRSQTRPQLHQLASQKSAESRVTNDCDSASSDGKDGALPPSLRTPEQLSPSPTMTRVRSCDEGGSAGNLAPAAPLDMRLLALAAYPPQHRPASSVTFEDNVQHLRCATACFLLSPECAKGVVGPCSATGARVCNVLRASLGVKWGAVAGRGSRLNLIQDKVILLRPYTTQQDAVAVQLDLGKLQERAMRSVAKVLPLAQTDSSTLPPAPPPGASAPQPKPGINPIIQDASSLPLQPEIEGALAPLLEAGFPGSSPLHVLRRKAAVLLLAYSIAVHSTQPDNCQGAGPVPEPDPEGWQLCTKRKPAARPRDVPSIADLATSASGFGAMPCTFLGSALHKMMPQMYVQLPPSNGGKHLKSIYQEVPCFVRYAGPRQSESYLKLDVPSLAAMGGCSADDLQHTCAAIAALGGASHSHLPAGEHSQSLAPHMPPSAAESGLSLPAPDTQQSVVLQVQPVAQQGSNTAALPTARQDAGTLQSTAGQEQQQRPNGNFAATSTALACAWQVDNGAPLPSQPEPPAADPWGTPAVYAGHTSFTTLPPELPVSTASMLPGISSSSASDPLRGFAPQQSQGCVSLPAPAAALPTELGGPNYPPGFGVQGSAFGSTASNSWAEPADGDEAEPDLLSLLLVK